MLGVITELELEVAAGLPAARADRALELGRGVGPFDELARAHRHYSFFWMPSDDSAALYGLATPGVRMADRCHVKIYDEVDDSTPDSDEPHRRVGPAYVIYPMVYEPNFHELEYFVPYERGREALAAMRELMLASLPASVFPMEVRTVGASRRSSRTATSATRSSSPSRERRAPTTSRTCATSTGCSAVRRARALGQAALPDARTAVRALSAGRRLHRDAARLDPAGAFLNDHLRPLFA